MGIPYAQVAFLACLVDGPACTLLPYYPSLSIRVRAMILGATVSAGTMHSVCHWNMPLRDEPSHRGRYSRRWAHPRPIVPTLSHPAFWRGSIPRPGPVEFAAAGALPASHAVVASRAGGGWHCRRQPPFSNALSSSDTTGHFGDWWRNGRLAI